MSRARITVAIAVVALTIGLAPSASAKFTTHNGADVTQTDVVNGDEFNTCGNRISGLAGCGTSTGDLDTTDPAVIDTVTRTVNPTRCSSSRRGAFPPTSSSSRIRTRAWVPTSSSTATAT